MERTVIRISLHWVCFDCRKQFRQALPPLVVTREEARAHPCPECGQAMVDLGRYFRPPARRKVREWEAWRQEAKHYPKIAPFAETW